MKCNTKVLATLCVFFFGTLNIVKADDDSEMKHIVGASVRFNPFNVQTGMAENLKKLAGLAGEEHKNEKYTSEGWNFGVEGVVNYDLYFNDLAALSVILKGGYNKIGTYKYDDGSNSGNSGNSNNQNNEKKLVSVAGSNVDLLVGPKFNFIPEGLSFSNGEQDALRFGVGLYGGIGLNFGGPTIGDESQLKDNSKAKIEGNLLAVPVVLDVEGVLASGLKLNVGCDFRFVSPIKATKEENTNGNGGNGNNNSNKTELSFSMGVRPYLSIGYDFGGILND